MMREIREVAGVAHDAHRQHSGRVERFGEKSRGQLLAIIDDCVIGGLEVGVSRHQPVTQETYILTIHMKALQTSLLRSALPTGVSGISETGTTRSGSAREEGCLARRSRRMVVPDTGSVTVT